MASSTFCQTSERIRLRIGYLEHVPACGSQPKNSSMRFSVLYPMHRNCLFSERSTASASREGSPHLSRPSPYPLSFPLPLLTGAFTQAAERALQCVDAANVRMHIQHEHRSLQSTLAGHSAFKGILCTPASEKKKKQLA